MLLFQVGQRMVSENPLPFFVHFQAVLYNRLIGYKIPVRHFGPLNRDPVFRFLETGGVFSRKIFLETG